MKISQVTYVIYNHELHSVDVLFSFVTSDIKFIVL